MGDLRLLVLLLALAAGAGLAGAQDASSMGAAGAQGSPKQIPGAPPSEAVVAERLARRQAAAAAAAAGGQQQPAPPGTAGLPQDPAAGAAAAVGVPPSAPAPIPAVDPAAAAAQPGLPAQPAITRGAAATAPVVDPAAAATAAPVVDPAAVTTAPGVLGEEVSPSPAPRRRKRRSRASPSPAPDAALEPPPAAGLPPGAAGAAGAAGAVGVGAGAAADAAAVEPTPASPSSGPATNASSAADEKGPAGAGAAANRTADPTAAAGSGANETELADVSSPPPEPYSALEVPPSPPFSSPAPAAASSTSNAATIAGAILGTLAALALLIGIAGCIACHRRQRLRKKSSSLEAQQHTKPTATVWDRIQGLGHKSSTPPPTQHHPAHAPKGQPLQTSLSRNGPGAVPAAAPYSHASLSNGAGAQQPYGASRGLSPSSATGAGITQLHPKSPYDTYSSRSYTAPQPPAGYPNAGVGGVSTSLSARTNSSGSSSSGGSARGGMMPPPPPRDIFGPAAAAAAAATAAAGGVGAAAAMRGGSSSSSRGISSGGVGMSASPLAVGFTADDLQERVQDLKHTSNKLMAAVDNAALAVDPIAAWIDAGMSEVRPHISNAAYGASHTFKSDWRTHRVWDWLNLSYWKYILSDDRLLDVQVPSSMSQLDFARRMLGELRRNPRFPPFAAAVDDAVDGLIEDAVEVARSMGALQAYQTGGSSGAGGGMPAAAQPAARYYRPVLAQLLDSAMRLHLQVQGTSDTGYIFVPGSLPAVSLAVPERGLVRRDRLGGGAVSELHYLCERPGVFSEDPRATNGVQVWVPANAIRVGLRQMY